MITALNKTEIINLLKKVSEDLLNDNKNSNLYNTSPIDSTISVNNIADRSYQIKIYRIPKVR
jgi:hypothetical protein